ncbi:hypothetical protein [Snodgrassella sp. CFCC 13594]|uniref:hypothetical protein n=1 Tax=Snodgrassella sp. CFCC 13594 TaxID=1775559 RepID=UPI000A7456EE|nr:hypothetical protein [Snodgrassella sp. CFCC 13594]
MIAPTIDWNRFEFTCAREDLNVPMPSPEAEAIFQRSREYNRLAFRKDSTNLLRESTILTLQAAEMGHVKAMSNLVLVYTRPMALQVTTSRLSNGRGNSWHWIKGWAITTWA